MTEKVSLYRHFDEGGNLLYVGISLFPISRQRNHINGARWADEIRRIEIEPQASKEEALQAERDAIVEENPKYNVRKRKPLPGLKVPKEDLEGLGKLWHSGFIPHAGLNRLCNERYGIETMPRDFIAEFGRSERRHDLSEEEIGKLFGRD